MATLLCGETTVSPQTTGARPLLILFSHVHLCRLIAKLTRYGGKGIRQELWSAWNIWQALEISKIVDASERRPGMERLRSVENIRGGGTREDTEPP
jgi:hypothetical protein